MQFNEFEYHFASRVCVRACMCVCEQGFNSAGVGEMGMNICGDGWGLDMGVISVQMQLSILQPTILQLP